MLAATGSVALEYPLSIHPDLLSIKHSADAAVLIPNHAHARGGVGHFLATGARGGLNRLPQAKRAFGSSGSMTARSAGSCDSFNGAATAASVTPTTPEAVAAAGEASASRAWERGSVRHPADFVSATRTVRPWDVPRGSRWAAVSFFETDPREVKRHMEVLDWIQATHDQSKVAERAVEQVRHSVWAVQQRDTFRRQRLEQAVRYTAAGMRPRSAYADLGATQAAEAVHSATLNATSMSSTSGSLPPAAAGFFRAAAGTGSRDSMAAAAATARSMRPMTAMSAGNRSGAYQGTVTAVQAMAEQKHAAGLTGAIPLPKKTFIKVYDRMAAESAEAPSSRAAAVAAQKAATEEEKKLAEAGEELTGIDKFEANLRALQRTRSRAAHMHTHERQADVSVYDDFL